MIYFTIFNLIFITIISQEKSWLFLDFKNSENAIIFIPTTFIELYLNNTKLMRKHFMFKGLLKRATSSNNAFLKKIPKNFCQRKPFSIISQIPQIAAKAHFLLLVLNRKEMNNFSSYLWTMFKLSPNHLCLALNNYLLPEHFFMGVIWNYHCWSLRHSLQSPLWIIET